MKLKTPIAFLFISAILVSVLTGSGSNISNADSVVHVAFEFFYDRDLSRSTAPFLMSGSLYVYYADYEKMNNINTSYYNSRLQQVRLLNINDQLTFDLANNRTFDDKGKEYDGLAVWRGGNVYLPAWVVADKFDLHYNLFTGAKPTPVAILGSNTGQSVNVVDFVNNTEALRNSIYATYLQDLEEGNVSQEPAIPQANDEPTLVYLTFDGAFSEHTVDIISTLGEHEVKAAFFITREDIRTFPDIVRELYADGHSIGIKLSSEEQSQGWADVNQLLKEITFSKTKLLRFDKNAADIAPEDIESAIEGGFRIWDYNISYTGDTGLSGMRNSISRMPGTAVVNLDYSDATAESLDDILNMLSGADYSLLTVKIWDPPINGAGELR